MSTVLLFLSVFVGVYIIYLFKNIWRTRQLINNALPGRSTNFFLGDLPYLTRKQDILFKRLREFAKHFPNGYHFWAGPLHGSLNLIKADDIEVVLTSSKHIEKGMSYKLLEPWLQKGLLTNGGNKWLKRRKILTPAFHFNILQRFINIFGEHGRDFKKELENECNKSKTNVLPLISKLTLNIICETAMGISLNSNDENEVKYRETVHKIGPLLVDRIISPWLYPHAIYNLTSNGRQANKYIRMMHSFSTNVIKERERTFREDIFDDIEDSDEDQQIYIKKRFAMLDLLITSKRNGDIDDDGIREEVDTFMFEGHDTTSMALCYSLLMMANHKQIQEKIRIEVDGIFHDSNRIANYEDLKNMQYLEMFLKEVLRLYPSVPFFARRITEEFKLGEKTVPVGCIINIHSYDLHRDPKVFPDPEKFDPERFSPENIKGRHPYAYIPFSAGPRNCIGQRFAMLEIKSVISSILRNFEIEPVDLPESVVLVADLVLRPKNGIHVKFKPRLQK